MVERLGLLVLRVAVDDHHERLRAPRAPPRAGRRSPREPSDAGRLAIEARSRRAYSGHRSLSSSTMRDQSSPALRMLVYDAIASTASRRPSALPIRSLREECGRDRASRGTSCRRGACACRRRCRARARLPARPGRCRRASRRCRCAERGGRPAAGRRCARRSRSPRPRRPRSRRRGSACASRTGRRDRAQTAQSEPSSSGDAARSAAYSSPVENPQAPCSSDSSSSPRIAASSSRDAGRSSRPTTASRSWPFGTRLATLTAGSAASRRSKYPAASRHVSGNDGVYP